MKIKLSTGEIMNLEYPYVILIERDELQNLKGIPDSCNRIIFYDDEKMTQEQAQDFLKA